MKFLRNMLASMLGFTLAIFLFVLIVVIVVSAMFSSVDQEVEVKSNSILTISLDKPIVDRAISNPFEGFPMDGFDRYQQIGLNDIITNIKKAKDDANIKGIYIELPFMIQARMASLEEIRNALADFKQSGKFVAVYGEVYYHTSYYLASVANYVWLNPTGNFYFVGIRSDVMFLKGTFDKLEIEPQLIRHGKFKGAGEMFVKEKLSDENRLQIQELIDANWNLMLDAISDSRGISKTKLNNYADNVSLTRPEVCYQNGIVDSLLYKDQVIEILKKLSGSGKKDPEMISLAKYKRVPPKNFSEKFSKPKIALIYATGDIVSGKDPDNLSSELISKEIRKARQDSTIRAIVLRVNSPGGSALASDIIWREMKLAAQTKPTVVSMGDVAASGGYYIACPADTIVADPTTITGSIGVFGVVVNGEKFLKNKLGVTFDLVKTNEHSGFPSFNRPLTAFEKDYMQKEIDFIYDDFVSKVAEGRGLTRKQVDNIAQGRVWNATKAKEIGLVDLLGGMDTALNIASKMAKLKSFRVVELPEQKDGFEELIDGLTNEAKVWSIKNELGTHYKYYEQYKRAIRYNGIQMLMPIDVTME